MKNSNKKICKNLRLITDNIIKAHEVTGHTRMSEEVEKMHCAVNKAIQSDERFNTPRTVENGGSVNSYKPTPFCLDITTPAEDGKHHAIISTAKGELVRHGFDYNRDEGTCKMADGKSCPTERTVIYAREIERHENMVKAMHELISCRASNGTELLSAKEWVANKPVKFIYAPAGISTINAGFRKNESITCTVIVDEDTPKDLQESFDYVCATETQEPFADEEHSAKKATLRFPSGKVKFSYGEIKGRSGVIAEGQEPTSYGAESVNGKVYASWSPEFATDAEYSKAVCKKGHYTFPDGVRGSATNPARLIAVGFVTGALTNKPAFRNMPPVKAKLADIQAVSEEETENIQAGAPEGNTNAAKDAAEMESLRAFTKGNEANSRIGFKHAYEAHERAAKMHKEIGNNAKANIHEGHAELYKSFHSKSVALKLSDQTESETVQAAATAATELAKQPEQKEEKPVEKKEPSALEAIFARHAQEQTAATTLAMRSPEIQAREERLNKKPDLTIESILARKQSERDFEQRMLNRNPLAANRETIDKLAAQKN